MSHARKAALHLLNNEWSRGVWKQWLSNIFQPPVEPPMPPRAVTEPAPGPEPVAPRAAAPAKSVPPSSTVRDTKRTELRARFDALSDRLMSVEEGLDTLIRRSAHRDKLDRRSELQSVEMLDNVAVASERQAAALEGLLGTVTRLEHSMARLEQSLAKVERAVNEKRRETVYPSQPPRTSPSTFPDAHAPPRSVRHSELEELSGDETSGMCGHLSEVSLPTVLAMLELERHTGRLKVAAEDGVLASFELSEGTVVSSRLSENDVDPLQALRTALCWKHGRFWFRPRLAEAHSYSPRSIGSLLLEATHQNDESFADVG